MIKVLCADNKVIYNAYHLVKAFYPEEEIASELQEGLQPRIRVVYAERDAAQCQSGEKYPEMEGRALPDTSETFPSQKADSQTEMQRIEAADIRELYIALRERTGRELPWGMLTGVRPIKLASKWIQEHPEAIAEAGDAAKESFADWFYEDRFVSRKKASMAFDVAMKERSIVQAAGKGYSLYIGIPFCPTVCSYCSFSSGEIGSYEDQVDAYLDALIRELEQKAASRECQGYPSTVYMGGGTPTSLNAQQLDRLLTEADRIFRIGEGLAAGRIQEFTVEAGRPDSITRDKLQVLKAHGVTRISVNPQSMQQKTLDAIGRHHSVEQVQEAFSMARELGFDNINMDLIMGLPGENLADVQDTLRQIRQLQPDSLTVHSLAVKRSSKIGIAKKTGTAKKGDEALTGTSEDIAAMIDAAYDTAVSMGMEPYYLYRQKSIAGNFENIGYAVPGKEGIYNVLIMEEVQSIIACGAGASTKIVTETEVPNPERNGQLTRMIRSENVKNIAAYIEKYC